MYIESLSLENFRNYSKEVFGFKNGINILTGLNAQGKTNAAEAIFFLCTGYSPRANRDKFVIKNGSETARISGKAKSLYGDISVGIEFNRSDKKIIYVNGAKVTKIGELLGNIHSVFFNPSELKLVQESPEDRRRFLNISLCQMSRSYFYALGRYNNILSQRNNMLKDPEKYIIRETLPVWDRQLSAEAAKIISARNDFIAQIAPVAEIKHAYLSDSAEKLVLKSECNYSGSIEEIAGALYADLQSGLERDMRLGFTGIGPHRDDIKFILNGEDARIYGSQGQQRTVALSLKLAETEIFKSRTGEYPILILDDVLSELDKKRQRRLFSCVEEIQTVFTAVGIDRSVIKNKDYLRINIENGSIKGKKDPQSIKGLKDTEEAEKSEKTDKTDKSDKSDKSENPTETIEK